MKIAVLLTVFNRKQKTLACLESLQQQELPPNVNIEVFLTDDGSSDGTTEAITSHFPCTHVYRGTGKMFWAGGMRHAWKNALSTNPDFYLLLNDDTMLDRRAVSILLDTSTNAGRSPVPSIAIGSTCNEGGSLSYGGWKLGSRVFWKSRRVYSEVKHTECDFGNANIMLVPHEVVSRIGILSDRFTHSLADFDYTLRAKKIGFKLRVPPGFLGNCTDDHDKNWKSRQVPLGERIAYLKSPKGLAYREYLHFIQQHFPLSYPSAFVKLWLKTFFPFIWDTFRKA